MSRRLPASRRGSLLVIAWIAGLLAFVTAASECPVPTGSHPTIQDAVDDGACLLVSLGAQSYPESVSIDRSLDLVGTGSGSSFVDGRVELVGEGTEVGLAGVGIRNGCPSPGLRVSGGARGFPADVRVESTGADCPPFAFEISSDGFESGGPGEWS